MSFLVGSVLAQAPILDLGANHEATLFGFTTNEEWVGIASTRFAVHPDSRKAINVDYKNIGEEGKWVVRVVRTRHRLGNGAVVVVRIFVLTLSLETLVLSLVEVSSHDPFLKFLRAVDREGIVGMPRNNVRKAFPFAFFQHLVKFPGKGRVAIASSSGQSFRRERHCFCTVKTVLKANLKSLLVLMVPREEVCGNENKFKRDF